MFNIVQKQISSPGTQIFSGLNFLSGEPKIKKIGGPAIPLD